MENETKAPDLRLRKPKFRAAVKFVLEWLGLESTVGNFKKYDSQLNWIELAHNLQNPSQLACCEVMDGLRKESTGKEVLVSLPGRTKEQALKELKEREYLFVRWW